MNLAKTLKPCNKNNYLYLTKYWSNIFYIQKYLIYICDGVALSQVFKFEIKMRCVKRQYCRQVLFVVSSLCINHKRHLVKRINDNIQTNDKIIWLFIFTSYLHLIRRWILQKIITSKYIFFLLFTFYWTACNLL